MGSGRESRWHDAWTLGDLLVRAAERDPQALAVAFPEERRTYSEMLERAREMARSLAGLGIGRGSHVGILMPNCLDFLDSLFGASLLGAVVVPINARFKPRELAHVIADGDIEVLLTSDLIEEHVDYVSLLHETLAGLAQADDPWNLALPAAPRLRAVVVLGKPAAGMVDRAGLLALGGSVSEDEVDLLRSRVAMRDVALMMYTSGTTAMPKGCPLSHEALVRTSVVAGRRRFHLGAEDRFWDPLPMFHMSAILPLIGVVDAGAAFITMTHFDPDVAIERIEAEGVTVVFSTFPAITEALINHRSYDAERFGRVRILNNVAPNDSLRALQQALPDDTRLISAYGCTECGGVVSFNDPLETLEQRTTTCGQPFDGIELGIRDLQSGEPVGAGERGEIVVRGYNLFEGYYKDPELTAERLDADGWFHTGDIGSLDSEGRVSYLGRLKDMLKVGGENVAAVEIESHLSTHPAVSIVAVVAVPDPKYVEVAAAFIQLKPGQEVTEAELIEHCRQGLARFKVPHYVRFVDSWPMSATKIQKFRLQEQLSMELQQAREAALSG